MRRQGCGKNPVGEEVTELGDGQEMFVVDVIESVFHGKQQKVECMDYAVVGGHGRLGEIAVEEFDRVRKKYMLGDGINQVESSAVLERWANVKALEAVEVP